MSRRVVNTMYKCGECGREDKSEDSAVLCEIEDREHSEIVRNSIDRVKVLSCFRDISIYYANSLGELDDYLRHLTSGHVDDWQYEGYKYPCSVLIREYEEAEPFEDGLSSYVSVINLDEFIEELESERNELESRLLTK